MSSFENWLRILSMESIHFFERETATVKKHFQKTCQFLFSVQNSSTLHRKRLEIASKIEKLDFYKLVKKCWQFHNSRHFTKSTTWVKTKPVFVGNLTWKAPHLYPLGLPVRLQGWSCDLILFPTFIEYRTFKNWKRCYVSWPAWQTWLFK